MKIQKKHTVIVAIVVVVLLFAGFGFVVAGGSDKSAWPGKFSDRDFGSRFHGKCFHKGSHGKFFSERFLGHLDSKMAGLDLSEDQEEKYREIRSKLETRLTERLEDGKQFMDELRTGISEENPDIRKLTDLIKERLRGWSGFMEENLDLFAEFYDMLDEDQKSHLLDRFREKMGS